MDFGMECGLCRCTSTYKPRSRKPIGCACSAYHPQYVAPPGCVFLLEVERTYDRSIASFAAGHNSRR